MAERTERLMSLLPEAGGEQGVDGALILSLIHILRAHETGRKIVCRLLLEKKKKKQKKTTNALACIKKNYMHITVIRTCTTYDKQSNRHRQ